MIFTCTVEFRPSQMRGGANITLGPISRTSCSAVSGSSGKLMVKPMASAVATDIICSPIQARGRKETNSSVGRRGSTWCRFIAMLSRLSKVSMAPLGEAVVPDDGHLSTALEAEGQQAQRKLADSLAVPAPARLAPDAQVFLPQRGPV